MTPRLRRLTGRELLRGPRSLGFEVVKMEGSHAKLRRLTAEAVTQTLTVPVHEELKSGTLVAIYRQLRRYVSEDEARPLFYR